jgi:hypothetical protein
MASLHQGPKVSTFKQVVFFGKIQKEYFEKCKKCDSIIVHVHGVCVT